METNLRALHGVRDVVVAKLDDPDRLVAWVIPVHVPADPRRAARDLRSGLAERLPAYMIPGRFHFVSAFPMTGNGKVDRRRLLGVLDSPP